MLPITSEAALWRATIDRCPDWRTRRRLFDREDFPRGRNFHLADLTPFVLAPNLVGILAVDPHLIHGVEREARTVVSGDFHDLGGNLIERDNRVALGRTAQRSQRRKSASATTGLACFILVLSPEIVSPPAHVARARNTW